MHKHKIPAMLKLFLNVLITLQTTQVSKSVSEQNWRLTDVAVSTHHSTECPTIFLCEVLLSPKSLLLPPTATQLPQQQPWKELQLLSLTRRIQLVISRWASESPSLHCGDSSRARSPPPARTLTRVSHLVFLPRFPSLYISPSVSWGSSLEQEFLRLKFFPVCMNLGNLPKLSSPQLPHLENRNEKHLVS